LTILQDKGYIVGSIAACSRCVVACYNVAWRNKSSAGSGNLVPPFAPQRRREGNISNPRVLSDMGLAIPRPTRLGDPRSVCASLSNIILTSLLTIFLFSSLTKSLETFQNSVRYPCSTNNYSSSLAVRSIFFLKSALYGITILVTELSLSS
jgi:hypothetical protein